MILCSIYLIKIEKIIYRNWEGVINNSILYSYNFNSQKILLKKILR
jgi:hypothetical protein